MLSAESSKEEINFSSPISLTKFTVIPLFLGLGLYRASQTKLGYRILLTNAYKSPCKYQIVEQVGYLSSYSSRGKHQDVCPTLGGGGMKKALVR